VWWDRLKKALGTASSDFVSASLVQLKAAAQFPGSGVSEIGINAALAQIEALAPKDEVEAALAVQMACTHSAVMSVLMRFENGQGNIDRVVRLASAAARLSRAFTMQVEVYRRLRHGGDQYVRVEHVHINEGAQAVIGNVRTYDDGRDQSARSDATTIMAPSTVSSMPRSIVTSPESRSMPDSSDDHPFQPNAAQQD
jgi:hypothetical protein